MICSGDYRSIHPRGFSVRTTPNHMTTPDPVRVLYIADEPDMLDRAVAGLEQRGADIAVETSTQAGAEIGEHVPEAYDCVVRHGSTGHSKGLEGVREDGFGDLPVILILDADAEEFDDDTAPGEATDAIAEESVVGSWDRLATRIEEIVRRDRIRAERKEYRALLEMIEDPMFVLDRDGTVRRANDALGTLLDVDPDELRGRDASAFVPKGVDVEEEIAELIGERREGPIVERTHIETLSGRTMAAELKLTPLFTEDGEFSATVGLVRRTGPSSFDWEPVREEEQVEKYETILRALGDPVYAVDADGRIAFVNEAYAEGTGMRAEELIGMPVGKMRDEEAVKAVEEAIVEVWHSDDRSKGTVELTRENGDEVRIVENHIALLPPGENGEFRGTAGVVRDITERVERERILEQYRSLVDAMTDPAAIYDREGRFRLVNEPLAERRLGRNPEDVVGERSLLIEAVREDWEGDPYRELIEGEREEIRGELEREREDGVTEVVDYRLTRVIIDGECRGAVSVSRDITQRKAQERQLRETRTVLRTVLENLPVGILVEDQERTIRVANDNLGGVLGISIEADDLIGRSSSRAIDEFSELFEEPGAFARTFEEQFDAGELHRHEERSLADGSTLERDFIPFRLGDEQAGMWIFREITTRKEREQELEAKNRRLEEFASMVSHDLRNPLNVAEGRLELAKEQTGDEHLEHIAKAHARIDDLIEDLLALAREGSVEQDATVDLESLASSCWETVATGDARLRLDVESEVVADASRVRQLLENLFRNAVEHGGEGVTVHVGEHDGGFYVEDDGRGIDSNVREEIFEPGFSTRSEGTGLGLSIVEQVANEHGWSVSVAESPNGGARFEIDDVRLG